MLRTLKVLAGAALLTFLWATGVLAAPNEEDEVQNFVSGFATAWNSHDMDALGKLFAPDADFVNVAGIWLRGRQEILLNHAWAHGTIPIDTPGFEGDAARAHYGIFKNTTLRFLEINVRFLSKDVALARVASELLGDSRTPGPRRSLILFVLTRQNGGWLIAAAQNTEISRTVK
jgi:Domain of unknown function (DUF4440)